VSVAAYSAVRPNTTQRRQVVRDCPVPHGGPVELGQGHVP
jgi:hypothetical protein